MCNQRSIVCYGQLSNNSEVRVFPISKNYFSETDGHFDTSTTDFFRLFPNNFKAKYINFSQLEFEKDEVYSIIMPQFLKSHYFSDELYINEKTQMISANDNPDLLNISETQRFVHKRQFSEKYDKTRFVLMYDFEFVDILNSKVFIKDQLFNNFKEFYSEQLKNLTEKNVSKTIFSEIKNIAKFNLIDDYYYHLEFCFLMSNLADDGSKEQITTILSIFKNICQTIYVNLFFANTGRYWIPPLKTKDLDKQDELSTMAAINKFFNQVEDGL